MAKQLDLDKMYMRQAYDAAMLSHATRRKVGAMLVIKNEGRFEGVNGTPAGFDNNPEFIQFRHKQLNAIIVWEPGDPEPDPEHYIKEKVTKDICLHAESNAITKVAKSHASTIGGTMYCTLAPCLECAKMIIQCEIARVVYSEVYPLDTNSSRPVGLKLLEDAGIIVDRLDMSALSRQYSHERDLEFHEPHHDTPEDMYRQGSYD